MISWNFDLQDQTHHFTTSFVTMILESDTPEHLMHTIKYSKHMESPPLWDDEFSQVIYTAFVQKAGAAFVTKLRYL